jgi:hypothetical protein
MRTASKSLDNKTKPNEDIKTSVTFFAKQLFSIAKVREAVAIAVADANANAND